VVHRLQEGIRHLVHVVGEVADAAVAALDRALAHARRRNLHRVALCRAHHGEPLVHQRLRREALVFELGADEARHVLERLREHELLPRATTGTVFTPNASRSFIASGRAATSIDSNGTPCCFRYSFTLTQLEQPGRQ
jgi:hypothetical protein